MTARVWDTVWKMTEGCHIGPCRNDCGSTVGPGWRGEVDRSCLLGTGLCFEVKRMSQNQMEAVAA